MAALTNRTHNNFEGGDSMTAQVVRLFAARQAHGGDNRMGNAVNLIREWVAEEKERADELNRELLQETDPTQQKALLWQLGLAEGRIEAFKLVIDLLTGRLAKLAEEFTEDGEAV